MSRRVVECVPNFSEGRNTDTIQEIAEAIRRVPGVLVLGQEQDTDHHRAVITYIGSPEAVSEAAVAAAQIAAARIDLRQHQGVHPRIGALDVLPFIPVENISLAECAELARRTAYAIWQRCGIPCYLYEAAALREDRRNLADVRRGGFEGLLRDVDLDPARRPDVGGPGLHSTAGAIAVGARKFLIAWNVLLRQEDPSVAREIASLVRQSSGGFPFVKALGLPLPSRGISQVSMNLLDFEETPMQPIFDVIRQQAAARGVEVIGTEVIGFLPRKSLEVNIRESLRLLSFRPDMILENRIERLSGAHYAHHEPKTVGSAFGYYQQSLELLVQASSWAARMIAAVDPAGTGFDWQHASHEIKQERESAHWDAVPTNTMLPVKDRRGGMDAAITHAERCATLKTHLAAERLRFSASEPDDTYARSYDAIWHVLEASLHFALLAVQQLMPPADLPGVQDAEITRVEDRDMQRIRALHALIGRR